MQTFTDRKGDEWRVTLDTAILKSIRKDLGIDLLTLEDSSLSALIADDEKLVDVISFICTDQIRKREMDASSFAAVLVGDAIDNACEALVGELVFISRSSRRAVVQKAWEKATAAVSKLNQEAVKMMDSPEMENQLNEIVGQFGKSLKTST